MAANILARDFKVPIEDFSSLDISPDAHVKRVLERVGLMPKGASDLEFIYLGRELNPKYPGIFDFPCWEIGKKWCKSRNPSCQDCYLCVHCPKKT